MLTNPGSHYINDGNLFNRMNIYACVNIVLTKREIHIYV